MCHIFLRLIVVKYNFFKLLWMKFWKLHLHVIFVKIIQSWSLIPFWKWHLIMKSVIIMRFYFNHGCKKNICTSPLINLKNKVWTTKLHKKLWFDTSFSYEVHFYLFWLFWKPYKIFFKILMINILQFFTIIFLCRK